MVDSGATTNQGPVVDMISEKDGDGGYVTGGWKSEDGKLSYGYSSFRGKRATMEDFYDIKTSKINGQMVCMFGIFDGTTSDVIGEDLSLKCGTGLSPYLVFNLSYLTSGWSLKSFRWLTYSILVAVLWSFVMVFESFALVSVFSPFVLEFSWIDMESYMPLVFVFGHGGSHAAEYLKQHLFENLMKHPKFITDTKLAISAFKNSDILCETYPQTDVDFLDSERNTYRDDGSTASTAVLVGNHLYVANVGDSRTIISKAGEAIPLSEDHKPNRTDERKRIENAGGVVMWAGTWRVGGVLAMSRAFGDRMLKQFVVAEPEIQDKEIDEEFELLVLASDGLWDVVPNEDAVSLAGAEEEPEKAARKLTEAAFTRGSADNITCIVVRFHHEKAAPVNPKHE
ncbi:hypothetical protein Gogos_010194 [Gossypium gossypioides]|uniref:PPM-type phosphatase domain-containing protein n=2 Tax=Gossypium TaxID=3633 RepID=A0A7J9BKI3_GOSGO|nr:hypothetical protein [Gossypium gossypioides]